MRLILAASLVLLPVQAFAAPPAATEAKPQSNKKICKVDPEETDSRIRRRICKTEAEWKGEKAEGKADAAGATHSGK